MRGSVTHHTHWLSLAAHFVFSALSPPPHMNSSLCLCTFFSPKLLENISSMLAPQADRVMALAEWEEDWREGKIDFHKPGVHEQRPSLSIQPVIPEKVINLRLVNDQLKRRSGILNIFSKKSLFLDSILKSHTVVLSYDKRTRNCQRLSYFLVSLTLGLILKCNSSFHRRVSLTENKLSLILAWPLGTRHELSCLWLWVRDWSKL